MSGWVRFSRSGSPLTSRRVVGEPLAPELLLGEAAALQQHAPGAVEHDDPLGERARARSVARVHGRQP